MKAFPIPGIGQFDQAPQHGFVMSLLVNWKQQDFDSLEKRVLLARHSLAELPIFSDDGLASLLDEHPESALTLSTMGDDCNRFEWFEGHRNGVSGKELLDIVKQGKLWINCRKILEYQSEISRAVRDMFAEMESRNPHFKAQDQTANLLISSPTAMVHYHVDMPVNMLWHIRGRKRVWVYPHFDDRFASHEVIEKVCAGLWSEDVPYDSSWDAYALVFDVQPGELLTWPQLAPHRVANLGTLCVSLSTEHKNPRARRRLNVFQANHLLRSRLGWQPRAADVDGWIAHGKQFIARIDRLCGRLAGKSKQQFVYPKSFVVDPAVQGGIRHVDDVVACAPHLAECQEPVLA
jgi:hypothetical protein